jgi:hypothetical protein
MIETHTSTPAPAPAPDTTLPPREQAVLALLALAAACLGSALVALESSAPPEPATLRPGD